MGMNLGGMIFLQEKGLLGPSKNRILDIGPQNVYGTSAEQIDAFVERQGLAVDQATFDSEKARLVYFSTPRPEERTTLFSEITDLTNIEYNSFDVCPALKTEILDLNFDQLPTKYNGYYDVVINFGTTEHIFNQWNSFEIMHDATKVGGIIYHQLPATGYLDHGYYCYTPLFFEDLAAANGYEVCELFFTPAGDNFPLKMGMDIRGNEDLLGKPHSGSLPPDHECVPCLNVHAILRKTSSAAFRVSLEIATAHAAADADMLRRYGTDAAAPRMDDAGSEARISELVADREQRIADLVVDREQRIADLVVDRERQIADLVVDREQRITDLVAERETLVSQLVAERENARGQVAELSNLLDAVRRSTSWRLTSGLRTVSRMFKG